jgi:hypothetical protein
MAMFFSDQITAPVNEFARLSGLGISTIWAMIKDERLETVAIGRRRLIVLDSYRRLIDEQRSAPVQPRPMPKGRPRQPRSASAG